jgi:Do/DeqQ family serine protease
MKVMNQKSQKVQTKYSYFFSAIIAFIVSITAIGGFYLLRDEPVTITHLNASTDHKVMYTTDTNGNMVPLDFTDTAHNVVDAVVHVASTHNQGTGPVQGFDYRQLPDPFREFFKDHPFGREYGAPGEEPDQQWTPQPMVGTGSGVIINEKGYIITNNHVIDQADEIEVTLHNNESYKARVVGTDPNTDLALLQIDAKGLKSLPMVNSDDVEVGEWVLAVGNPFSLNSTVTAGIVSAKARNININKEKFAVESFIQTDAAINPGNSGGALVNLDGGLVGINTAIASRTGTYNGYGFAIPSNIVTKVVEDLLKYGSVQRGVLGVSIQTINSNLAKEKNFKFTPGVYVAAVTEHSAAEKAGIKEGDVIVSVDGTQTDNSPTLQEIIARHRPGDAVSITYLRDGKENQAKVVLENMNGTTKIIEKEHPEVLNLLGADFETLDKSTADKLGLKGGVKVTNLYAGKIRQETQMRPGFIITHVDGREIRDIKELSEALKNKQGGTMLEGRYEDLPGKYYYAFGMDQ